MSEKNQLDSDFVDFISERVKNVKSPMILSELCREYKKKNGISYTDNKLIKRLCKIRNEMSEMDHIDIDTKVKIMYALSSPVSNGLMIELKKEADVEVDEHHRIIEYKQHGTGLQLSGVHMAYRRTCNIEIEKKMLKFLAQTSENATSPMTDQKFLKEYMISEGNLKSDDNFNRYNLLKQQIYLAPEFDQETKIKMIFVSNTKVYSNILEELRQNAVVEVDEHRRITKYKANDGSLELKGEHKKYGLIPIKEWTKLETDKLVNFIAEKSKQTEVPLTIIDLSRKFLRKNEVSRTMPAVVQHIRIHLVPNISKLNQFDKETRMRMMFVLSAPIDKGFLKELRNEAVVEVDECQRITKYKANDGNFELKGVRQSRGWEKEEKKKLLNFIAQKSKQTKVPLFIEPLCREYAEKDGVSRTVGALMLYIHKLLLPTISKLDQFDIETRIRMMFALRVPADEEFLQELRKNAVVEIDKKRRITKYKANDGSLVLDGDHSRGSKIKRGQIKQISHSECFDDSENDEKTEDDEDKDDEEEDVKEEVSRFNTKSGRISKQRYPDVDIDDISFDPPENLENSKVEKETKDLLLNFSNSSSKVPLVKNQKRKIVRSSSKANSSSSKSRKHRKYADTQNGTESNEAKKNDDREVIYDDPGEPPYPLNMPIKQELLSYEVVKLEDEEYKPDLSFLCGTTQEAMPRYSVAEGIHSDDVDLSTESTDEMTSEKEFIQLLRGLVDTLDSPIFVELQSKIEKAIEKLGDRDHKIPTDEIVMTLNTGLIILNKNATTTKPPTRESTSLRDFFLILRSTLSTFHSSSLSNFHSKLKENIKKLDSQDKNIPVESIRTVLETVCLLIIP